MHPKLDPSPSTRRDAKAAKDAATLGILTQLGLVLGIAASIVALLVSALWTATATVGIAALLASLKRSRWRRHLQVAAALFLLASVALFVNQHLAESAEEVAASRPATREELAEIEEKIDRLLEPGAPAGAEVDVKPLMVQWINGYRSHEGLPPYEWEARSAINTGAQRWAETMASRDVLEHNPDRKLQSGGCSMSGANIAYGYTWQGALEAFSDSDSHALNLTSAIYNTIGVGIATGAKGTTYIALDFAHC